MPVRSPGGEEACCGGVAPAIPFAPERLEAVLVVVAVVQVGRCPWKFEVFGEGQCGGAVAVEVLFLVQLDEEESVGGVEREVVVGGVDSGEPLRITAEGLVHVADQVLVDGFKMRHPPRWPRWFDWFPVPS